MSKKTPSVFISHSSKDNEFVLRLEQGLKENGIEVWVDYDRLDIGNSLYGEIAPAIDTADYFALLWSSNSKASPWVKRELNAALAREDAEDREIILPVLLESIPLPTFLRHQVYADFTSGDKFDESLKKLVRAIKKAVPKPAKKAASGSKPAKLYPNQFLPDLKFFVGRKELLKQIQITLDKDHRAAIHDISGLGKTFTTYKFAHDNQGNYDHIFFIRATREEMLESLAKCGELVEPELAGVTEQLAKALTFKRWLEENEKWLVIYDNVYLPGNLLPFVPVSKKGDCIFTSNFREVRNLGTEISIVKLDKTDAEILLYSRANNKPLTIPDLKDDERSAFDRLIKEIDGLPLTLNSTGALIDKKQWLFTDLWQRYERSNEILWESEDIYSAYKYRSAHIVFSLAYNEICVSEQTGDLVKIILDSICFISPDEIPEDLLKKTLATVNEHFAQMEEQDDLWDDIREKLTAYDLMKYDRQKNTFTTHRAIQRVIQRELKGKEKGICIALASMLSGVFPTYDYSNRDVCEKYYQHVLVLVEHADRFGVETKDTNELYFRLGEYQRLLGNYAVAERFHLRAAEISAAVFGEESEISSRDLNGLALVYGAQGRHDEASDKLEKALRICERTIGPEQSNYTANLNNLGEAYRVQGRYDDAIEKFENALRIDKKAFGREHPACATYLNNLALVYNAQGKYDEAIEKLKEVLWIDKQTIGYDHPGHAIHLNNLASIYENQGRYDDAIKKYETAIRIDEKTIGREHPTYATHINNLANVYATLQKFPAALDLYKNALRILEKKIPEDHSYITNLKEKIERYEKG